MAQPAFLARSQFRPFIVEQAARLAPRYHALTVETGRANVGGLVMRETKLTGKVDKSQAEVYNLKRFALRFPLTAEGVKSCIRRLRPQEAEELESQDALIAELEQQLRAARVQRAEILKVAFQRGHVVTVQEIRAACEDKGLIEGTVEAEQP